jgi:hypothetical protein
MMDQDPTYTLWHPTLQHKPDGTSVIMVNVTPGAYDRMPTGPRAFFKRILEDIGVNADPRTWEILVYRSRYHGEPEETASWRVRWPINWRLSITLTQPLAQLPPLDGEYFESYAFSGDPQWHTSDQENVACLVIADFQRKSTANRARTMVKRAAAVARTEQGETAVPPKFYGVEIGELFYQWQINLGQFPNTFFEHGADYALRIEAVCRQAGGITTFDERALEWDEL